MTISDLISKGPCRWHNKVVGSLVPPENGRGVGVVYKGFSPSCYWSLRRKEALAHSSSSARRAAPRRGIEPSRAHSYALLFAGQERRVFDRWGHDLRRRIVGYRLGRGFSPRLSTRGRTYICGALPTLAVTKQNASPPPRPWRRRCR